MKKCFSLLTVLFWMFTSCNENEKKIESIEYRNDYKFNSEIEKELKESTFEPSDHSHHYDTDDKGIPLVNYQISAGRYSEKGDYKMALKHWDIAFGGSSRKLTAEQIDSVKAKYQIVPAVNYITEQAKSHEVVIINEAHHNPFHRVFTKKLLKDLYDLGYRNLGLETLGYRDTLLNKRKYPVKSSGYYSDEPQFGDMIRTALEIGYKVFPYESSGGTDGTAREIEQARNIQRVINENPNEKFLIHCGFGHVVEGDFAAWGKAMAGRLKEFTNLDPLTINQEVFSERSRSQFNHPLLNALDLKGSSVLIDAENKPLGYQDDEKWTDLAVFHPASPYTNGRPDWFFENGKENVRVQLKNIDISFPIMLLAFKVGEDIHTAIPFDILELENPDKIAHLALEQGKYNIVAVNENGEALKFQLEVR